MGMCEPSTAPTTYGIWCKSWNSCAYLSIVAGVGQLMNFLSKFFFMAPQNSETACWLDERPIRYKSAMHCMELPEANLEIDTATFTWTGMAKRMFVSRLCKSGARITTQVLKCGDIHTHSPLELPWIEWTQQILVEETRFEQTSIVSPQSPSPSPATSLESVQSKCHATKLLPMP